MGASIYLQGNVTGLAFDVAFGSDIPLVKGDNSVPADTNYEITINADDGYIISGINGTDGMGFPIDIPLTDNVKSITFEIYLNDFDSITINVDTIEDGSVKPVYISGFNHVYKVDRNILKSVASERFITDTDTIDLGQFIINVLEIPFSIPIEYENDLIPINLGNYTLNTKAIELNNDEIIIPIGSIEVPNKFNNSYDYINTNVKLYLPYSQTIELEIEYVIGYTITINYIINVYTGDITINIVSSRFNTIIHSENTRIGKDIPFITTYNNEPMNVKSSSYGLNNGVLNAYIEVIRNVPYEQNNIFKTDVLTYESLTNVKGFVSVNNIILNSKATQSERDNIITLLRNGVFIK